MKTQTNTARLTALLLIPVLIAGISCSRKVKHEGNLPPFEADTLRGTALEFSRVESGHVTLKNGALDLLGEVDENGFPKIGTSDAVSSFEVKNEFSPADGTGMAIRFSVPAIADNDYCIIRAEITLPGKVSIGGQLTDVINADFRYDAKNSGHTEYIWFLFSKNAPELMLKGNWSITLSNNSFKLLSAEFIVK